MLRMLCFCCLLLGAIGCNSSQTNSQPEPHLELGQRITFVGGDPQKAYVVAGYRDQFEDKTEKEWSKQAYVVFTYFDNQGNYMQGVVHRNAILKE